MLVLSYQSVLVGISHTLRDIAVLALSLSLVSTSVAVGWQSLVLACDEPPPSEIESLLVSPRLSNRMGWVAEEIFDDSMTVALCEAIEDQDVLAIERLAASGADVNDIGDGNITPLLWAFDGHLPSRTDAFSALLKRGADPNVRISRDLVNSELGVPEVLTKGSSVMLLACTARWPTFFDEVLIHGGDPNCVDAVTGRGALSLVLTERNKLLEEEIGRRIVSLINAGAELDQADLTLQTPAMVAARAGMWGSLKLLLENDADVNLFDESSRQVIHHVAMSATSMREMRLLAEAGLRSPEPAPDAQGIIPRADLLASYRSQLEYCDQFDEVVAMLAERGFDLAEAERDLKLARHYAEQGDPFYFKKRRQKREAEGLDQPARPEAAEQR